MEEQKEIGPIIAQKRVHKQAKLVWFLQQGEVRRAELIRRRRARQQAEENKKYRRKLQRTACFTYWTINEQFVWLREALLVALRTLHSICEMRKNTKSKMDAFSQDYFNVLSKAYFPTEESIFDHIR